jgi:hypothetical protein
MGSRKMPRRQRYTRNEYLALFSLGTVVSMAIWLSLVFAHPTGATRILLSITAVSCQLILLAVALQQER